jgi:ubiquinone/menaquinone biosynthesis C-methylase UbiE
MGYDDNSQRRQDMTEPHAKTLVQSQFGAHAAAYVTSPVHAKGASLGRLVELVKPQKHWHALDIATAAGHTALAFSPHVASVIASDLTDEMLVEAKQFLAKQGATNATTAKADAEALPFEDAAFDLVTCRIAPHHFPDVARFVSEAWRVLKPGGVFALVDNVAPDTTSVPGTSKADLRSAAIAYNAFEKLRDPSHGRCLSTRDWLELISDMGFAIEHTEHLAKDMEFQPWAERLGADAPTISRLREILDEAEPALNSFLVPRHVDGALWFTVQEAVIIARKAPAPV